MILRQICKLAFTLFGLSNFGLCDHEVCSQLASANPKVNLRYDQALLQIQIQGNESMVSIQLDGISSACDNCHPVNCAKGIDAISAVVSTVFPFRYHVRGMNADRNEKLICHGEYHFKEHGHYMMYLSWNDGNHLQCGEIQVEEQPDFVYLPLVVLFAVVVFLIIIYNIILYVLRKQKRKRQIQYSEISAFNDQKSDQEISNSASLVENTDSQQSTVKVNSRQRGGRLKSLDTFRGISIVIMIFVNYTGGRYWFFNHSSWNGLTVADLVFPWFIFIMGSSIFISFRSLRRKNVTKKAIAVKITFRSVKLLLLGLFLNNGYDLSHWRLPGVLQRFAISYFVVAMVNVIFSPNEDEIDTQYSYDWRDAFRDLSWFYLQHIIMVIILTVYLLITFLVHDPHCPKGYLGPGGYSHGGNYANCTGGAARYIDLKVFGYNHIYHGTTCKTIYNCASHDPEGLLGVFPSIFLTYLGLQASRILFMYSKPSSHVKRWLIWAMIWGAIGCGLCGATQNDGVIPVNKNLWSLSFIFVTGAMAYFLLTICYALIDLKKWWSGAPFYFAGMNALLLYVGHEVFRDYLPFRFQDNGQHWELLLGASIGTSLWMIISYICYKSNIFLKI